MVALRVWITLVVSCLFFGRVLSEVQSRSPIGSVINCMFAKHSKVYSIQVDEWSLPFNVLCNQQTQATNISGGGWTVIANRYDGSETFHNRSWYDFKDGFGTYDGEFFLGLDQLHALLSSRPHELLFVMQDFNNETHYQWNNYFAIDDERYSYTVSQIGKLIGSSSMDGFPVDYREFCTFDRPCRNNNVTGWNSNTQTESISHLFSKYPTSTSALDAFGATGSEPILCWRRSISIFSPCVAQRSIQMLIRPTNKYIR